MNITKRIFVASAFLAMAFSAGAQSMYDAINFSQNDYFGTARSMAVGNAVTALGGDLGTVGINPAGSAVSGYSQFEFTPGLSISSVTSNYSPVGEQNYGADQSTGRSRFTMPNFGASFNYTTGNRRGVKSYNFAFIANQTYQYNYAASVTGANDKTSKLAEFANAANGWGESVLSDYDSFQNSNVPWDVLTAYQGGMFGSYGTDGEYAGVTEAISPDGKYHYVPGTLSQFSDVRKYGSKQDYIFNCSMNINDNLFLGFNLGIPSGRYTYDEYYAESSINPDQFQISFNGTDGTVSDTYFNSASYEYKYVADYDGIYAKIGAIWLPMEGLRLGAAFQTPTILTVSESWQHMARTSFADSSFNYDQTSPTGDYSYCLRTPYSATFGIAYTIGQFGFISVDYELTDYSVMKFSEYTGDYYDDGGGYYDDSAFIDVNSSNKHFAGISNNLRIGGELRVTPLFSIRAGFGLITSPERHWTNNSGEDVTASTYVNNYDSYSAGISKLVSSKYYGDKTTSLSFGFGYSSPGAFFADVAAKWTRYPDSTFSPYYDYDNCSASGASVNALSPKIFNLRNLWNVALTMGWRF